MKRKIQTEQGECFASIKTEAELEAIRMGLATSEWLLPTFHWLEAIKDPTRFQIVFLLYRYQRLCVCDLANILGVSSSAISQHLRRLRDMNFVSSQRVKQTVFYYLFDEDFISFFRGFVPEEVQQELSEGIEAYA